MLRKYFFKNFINDSKKLLSTLSSTLRNEKFSKLNQNDIDYFTQILGKNNIISNKENLEGYNKDWTGEFQGKSNIALFPKSTEQVSKIISRCYERNLAIVPQSGNTGLVGGSVPVFDEIILSTQKMNQIIKFDKLGGSLTCESGCILEILQEYLNKQGYLMPLDLGSKGSCCIGGNVSTSAGGMRYMRYGSMHSNVLGLEVVLANGQVLDLIQTLRKDNTGYDLKHLFIGSEGTLGIITKVAILCPPLLSSPQSCYLACKSFDKALDVMLKAKSKLGESIMAIEFLDLECKELCLKYIENVRDPLPESKHDIYIVIEVSGSNPTHDKENMELFLTDIMEEGMVEDGVVAQDSTQALDFMKIRESIPEALRKKGNVFKFDLAFPFEIMYDIVRDLRSKLKEENIDVYGFGHMGDGDIHVNISYPKSTPKAQIQEIENYVYDYTMKSKGTISAEHGIGLLKVDYMNNCRNETSLNIMKSIKNTLDEKGILNPYKVLPMQ